MKIALCLQGLSTGHNDKGNYVKSLNTGKSIQSNIIKDNVDVFIHTWNEDIHSINELTNLYQPKKSIFEKQIMFDDTVTKYHYVKSRWYSQMKSIELKKQYEMENNFTYDFVMVSRFDCFYYTPINFTTLNPTRFYTSNWPSHHLLTGFLDYWFISNSSNMDLFGGLYNKLDQYMKYLPNEESKLSSHVLSKHHITKLGLINNISYILNEPKDFKIDRNY